MLKNFHCNFFQFPVQVRDNGFPQLSDTVRVTVIVERNNNAPRFDINRYSVDIKENMAVGESVITVRATDSDPQVSAGFIQLVKSLT